MSKIDYQKLREIAEKTKIAGEAPVMPFDQRINALNDFMKHFSPDIALALLDELERNQQYIKRRDQENEDIALTVGKLRVELEETKSKLNEQREYYEGVISDGSKRIAELEAEPVSQAYNLAELIEGMEVSIDVSTCDADLGNRYFGTVTEALELDTAKNGYILLVQDAEPNFDVNGNYPVTPDGWISCSDLMPEDTKMLLAFSQGEIVAAYWNWVVNPIDYKKYRAFTYLSGNILDDVTHWMPLPEPPQEAK
ncbi:ead/Ea22-like family protein [Escherichia coli]|uniref:ead/Ea22-like family protein n=1 Tax=Escherichia coli TaxID=562 RepID=UPI0003912B74|nr:ead/Ea22-like family protein [Escherichia coli]EQV87727.1 hypothetical protein G890_02895 [Escherichia coli KOEGE 62 (175a)]